MRKKFLLFFAIFSIVLLGLCSCSDDKDDEYKDAIIGTWELIQVGTNIQSDTKDKINCRL